MNIEWTDDLSVDDATLDDHHKNFFDQFRSVQSNPIAADDTARLFKLFDFLDEHIFRHFQYEENYMRNHGFPEFEEHKVLHDQFVDEFQDFKKSILSDEESFSVEELVKWMGEWWTEHIKDKDQEYARYIREHQDSHPVGEADDYHTVVHK